MCENDREKKIHRKQKIGSQPAEKKLAREKKTSELTNFHHFKSDKIRSYQINMDKMIVLKILSSPDSNGSQAKVVREMSQTHTHTHLNHWRMTSLQSMRIAFLYLHFGLTYYQDEI